MTRVFSRRPVTAEVGPYGIYGGHTATAAGFTPVIPIFLYQYHFMTVR